MDLGKYIALFRSDSHEHLQSCNALLLEWERAPSSLAPVGGLFRSIHTIKGMAATLGYGRLAELSHTLEGVLALVRDGLLPVTPRLVDLCFRCVDTMETGVEVAVAGRDDGLDTGTLIADLTGLLPPDTPVPPEVVSGRTAEFMIPEREGKRVRVKLRRGTEMAGARAALVLLKAELLGSVSEITPPRETFTEESFRGGFSFRLDTSVPDEAITRVIREAGEVAEVQLGERSTRADAKGPPRQVRVDLRRLDALVSQVGELVIARNRLMDLIRDREETDLEVLVSRIARLVTEVQQSALESRLAPVREVFERFPRPIRDLARHLGKKVRLSVEGADIEIDRAVLDELGGPLLHLLRNAVDHGIESPDVRLAAGKPEEGQLTLRAERGRHTVLIRVSDDGRGVDRRAVEERARRDGLLSGALDDAALLRLLGRPGFSTAEEITAVSGRGVGIDVVLTRLRALGGRVDIHTAPGEGTTFELRLPLTRAIVPALLVGVGAERYALPLAYVSETVAVEPASVRRATEGPMLEHRGGLVPLHSLDRMADVASTRAGLARPTVVFEAGNRRAALLVDTLVGTQDLIVEPVDAPLGMPDWINGATILGDGQPALVVDPAALL